jgi:hypothetical protein
MGKEPRNQQFDGDDGYSYALDEDIQVIQQVLASLRQAGIMMWAYRFDHARYVMGMVQENYGRLLERARDATREQAYYSDELFENADIETSALRRKNPYVAVAGIATKVEFLTRRLNMNEERTSPDNRRFEYGLLQLEDNTVTIRTYRFDDIAVNPTRYIETFQRQRNVNFELDRQISDEQSDYPFSFRLFGNDYFAEIMIFAPDYAEIQLSIANRRSVNETIINFVQLLDETRID